MATASAAAIGKAAVALALAKHGLRGAVVRRKAQDCHDYKWWGVSWLQVEIRSGVLDWLGERPQFGVFYEIDTSDPYLKYRWDVPFLSAIKDLIAALDDFDPGVTKRVFVGSQKTPYIFRKNP